MSENYVEQRLEELGEGIVFVKKQLKIGEEHLHLMRQERNALLKKKYSIKE
jgi:hypothetical protein